ncbi:hypothetical protein Tco_0237508 [Tanacetum coccineum]
MTLLSSLITKLPPSKSCAIRLTFVFAAEELDDQMFVPPPLTIDKTPWLSNMTIPNVSMSGVSRLATHSTVCGEVFLNHIPRYRFFKLSGLKKPSSNRACLLKDMAGGYNRAGIGRDRVGGRAMI